ncbi:hypothetical protein ACFSTC_60360 [Nonomuraea ferruginea]
MTEPPPPAASSAVGGDPAVPQDASQVQVNVPCTGGVVNAVQDGVLNVYQWKPAYRIEEFPAAPRPVWLSPRAGTAVDAVAGGSRVVPFTGRGEDLQKLTDWRDDKAMPRLGMRLLHGPGGSGQDPTGCSFR